jgi:hypothetical protein
MAHACSILALHRSSPKATQPQASQLQRLEVRAFGYLLQELAGAQSDTVASPVRAGRPCAKNV